jgi:hypothetical protein
MADFTKFDQVLASTALAKSLQIRSQLAVRVGF